MILVYCVNKGTIKKRISRDHRSINEGYGTLMRTMILIIMPIILSAFIYNVNGYINSYMYTGIMGIRGMDTDLMHTLYAEYGFFMTLINIPLTLASTAPTSMIPEVSAPLRKGGYQKRQCQDRAGYLGEHADLYSRSSGTGRSFWPHHQTDLSRDQWSGGGDADPWRCYDHFKWQFQYLQWGAPGDRKAKDPHDPCSHCAGGGCGGDGPFAFPYRFGGLYHCDRYDLLCSDHVRIKRPVHEAVYEI